MKTLRFLLAIAVIAAITHYAALMFGPSLIMGRAMGGILQATGGPNAVLHAPRPAAGQDRIVRSSPDLLYSACVYDLTHGPVRVRAEVPQGTYWSVSFYDMNTVNYRVINDAQATAGAVLLVLTKAGSNQPTPAGAEIVASPTDRGIILFRTLINDEANLNALDTARRDADCRAL